VKDILWAQAKRNRNETPGCETDSKVSRQGPVARFVGRAGSKPVVAPGL